MIEFNGRISGKAEKHFANKARIFAMKCFLIGGLIVLTPVICITVKDQPAISIGCLAGLALIFLLCLIPQSKKEREKLIPRKIYIENQEYIVAISNVQKEERHISDVKQVIDYGEFYDITFNFGKASNSFICQKDLLTSGTLDEFDLLFGDKLIRK